MLAEYAAFSKGGAFPIIDGGTGGSIGRFFSGHWGRHHGNAVQDAVGYYYHMSLDFEDVTVQSILKQVKTNIGSNIKLQHNGDLYKIMLVIKANTGIDYDQILVENAPDNIHIFK